MRDKLKNIFLEIFELEEIQENFDRESNEHIWDSIKHLALVVEVEYAFNLSLSPEEINSIQSFYSVLELIERKLK